MVLMITGLCDQSSTSIYLRQAVYIYIVPKYSDVDRSIFKLLLQDIQVDTQHFMIIGLCGQGLIYTAINIFFVPMENEAN